MSDGILSVILLVIGWLINAFIVGLAVYASILWRKAFTKLREREEPELVRIKQKIPSTFSEAQQLVDYRYDTVCAKSLRHALQDGIFDADNLNFFEWIHWPRYYAGIFVFIGLLGTVLGIATAVSSLGSTIAITSNAASSTVAASVNSSSFTIDSWTRLLHGIDNLLSGMKYASVCTLVGLIATLFVSFLNSVYMSKANTLAESLKTLAYDRFVPLKQKVGDKQLEHNLLESIMNSSDRLSQSVAKFSDQITPAAEHFGNISKDTIKVVDQFAKIGETLKGQYANVEDAYTRIQKLLVLYPAENYTHLEQAAISLANASDDLATQRSGLSDASRIVGNAASEMQSEIRLLRESLVDNQEVNINNLQSVIGHIDNIHNKLAETLRRFETTLADISAVSDSSALRVEIANLLEHISMTQQSTTIAAKSISEVTSEVRNWRNEESSRRTTEDNAVSSLSNYIQNQVVTPIQTLEHQIDKVSSEVIRNSQKIDNLETHRVRSNPVPPAVSPEKLISPGNTSFLQRLMSALRIKK